MKSAQSKPTLASWATRHANVADAPAWWKQFLESTIAGDNAKARDVEPELLETLDILESLRADSETLAACIVHTLPSTEIDVSKIPHMRDLLDGQQAAEKVWSLYASRGAHGSAEGLRRLLLAIIRDLRVVFILLARQLATLRLAGKLPPERQRDLAQLTADIHAPLANRLGIWQLKWELEDLAFRYLHPDIYRRVATLLDERRDQRETFISEAAEHLRSALAASDIAADVAGRPKHIYSIWKKMQRKGDDFASLYDIRALRVLVSDVPSCYAALGIVHTLWPPVPSEFDDYIARPKGNHYQSLHTAVVGPEGKTLEVQIRSHDMHAHAEQGVAAHWRYKEGGGGDQDFERKIAWMRQLLESKDDNDDETALLAGFKTAILEDRVYLLTPQGQVIDLPRGATVLDFAYTVHTDVGHRTRGAKVNGRIVPLNFQPASGDRVEILTGKVKEPRRDWLSAHHALSHDASRAAESARLVQAHGSRREPGGGPRDPGTGTQAAGVAQRGSGFAAAEIRSRQPRRLSRRAGDRRSHRRARRARPARDCRCRCRPSPRLRRAPRGTARMPSPSRASAICSRRWRDAASRCRATRSSATSREERASRSIAPIARAMRDCVRATRRARSTWNGAAGAHNRTTSTCS